MDQFTDGAAVKPGLPTFNENGGTKPLPPPVADPWAIYCQWWLWAISHAAEIPYSEGATRLEDEHRADSGALPLPPTDCSGLTLTLASWTPGFKPILFNGVGNTDTLKNECAPITEAQARGGDLAEFANHAGATSHVVTLLKRLSASDFDCGSHGSPGKGQAHHVTLSAEAAYQASVGFPVVIFRRIPTA